MLHPYTPTDRTTCLQIFKGNCPVYFDMSELEGFEMWLDGQDEGRNGLDEMKHHYPDPKLPHRRPSAFLNALVFVLYAVE